MKHKTLVIRHRPQRDADNTWHTWIAAPCGADRVSQGHRTSGAPLAGRRPAAAASMADTRINAPVLYELWM